MIKKSSYRIIFFIVIFCLIAIFLGVKLNARPIQAPAVSKQEQQQYQKFLVNDEKKAWKKKKWVPGEAYIQLNQRVLVNNQQAQIHLVNPPYCGYDFQLKIELTNQRKIIYRKKRLRPGVVLDTIPLSSSLNTGEYPAEVSYTFFDGRRKKRGNEKVKIMLVVE